MNEIIIKAALKAGEEIMKVYNSSDFQIDSKEDDSPITLADKNAHSIILNNLQDLGYPILSEEGEDALLENRQNWKEFWLVDPLDGTKEFINKNDEFTVNIALIKNHNVVEGVVYAPALKSLYFTKDNSSFVIKSISNYSEFDLEKAKKLKKAEENDVLKIVVSKSHLSVETQQKIDEIKELYPLKKIETVAIGSSLKFCILAEGKANFYPRYSPTMEWDTAAGHAICKNVGIPVLQAESKEELLYNKAVLKNPWFEAGYY